MSEKTATNLNLLKIIQNSCNANRVNSQQKEEVLNVKEKKDVSPQI